jgi:hypothetical protein
MSFDYWNQYKSEMERIRAKANPIHAEHIEEFERICKHTIDATVPQMVDKAIEKYNQRLSVAFETYLNGELIHHRDITKGVCRALQRAIDEAGAAIRIDWR